MSKNRLSPLTSVVVSLSIALGILVADLTSTQSLSAARAQGKSGMAPLAAGRVVGQRIVARNVLVNGVVTDGVFLGSVAVVDSAVVSRPQMFTGIYPSDGFTVNGIYPSDGYTGENTTRADGIYPSDGFTVNGIYPSDGFTTTESAQLVGGSVLGSDVSVVDGVITGRDLRVAGTVVQGGAVLSNGDAALAAP